MESVYAKAQELGYTGSLEEFIASVSGIDGENGKDGKDGVNGVGIEEIYINAEGHLLFKLTGQATHTDLGKVVGEDGEVKIENEQGLDFYLKDDGTYGVKAGTASYLTEITIPATYKGRAVTEVLDYFFGSSEANQNARTQSIIIPDSVTSIGGGAFYDCDSLTSITIPDSVTSIGSSAFSSCDSLTSIAISDGVTSIGGGAFSWCSSLTSITIPDSVTSIGNYSFSDCYSLTSITIPDSVTSIGDSAFAYCRSLQFNEYGNAKYLGNETNPYLALITVKSKNFSNYTIHSDTKLIADSAFSVCSSLTSITIPDSVTSIGESAFSACYDLTRVYYKGSASDWASITIGESNYYLTEATRYYYSEEEPTDNGNYWYYDEGGNITVW